MSRRAPVVPAFAVPAFAFLVLFAGPLVAWAQGTEKYLPSGSQILVQVDAHAKTKAAYDRTVAGQMMQGDTGKFLEAFYAWALKSGETLADHFDAPSKEDVALIKDGLKALERIGNEGLAMGIEIKKAWPPQGRFVVVLPKLATGPANLNKILADVRVKAQGGGGDFEIKDLKVAGRTGAQIDLPVGQFAWWSEGDDFLLSFGTEPVADYIKLIDAGKTGLANNSTYKKLIEIGAFPAHSRAFVDMPGLTKLADDFSPEAGKTVDALGLKGMGAYLSIAGYDGPAQRTLTEVEVVGPRKGLMTIASEKKFSLADVPPMPSDLTTFSVSNANGGKIASAFVDVIEKVIVIYAPEQLDNVKAGIKGVEDAIGVDLRNDLLGSFGDMTVSYTSPSEGIFGTGGATLFKVADEAKLKKALANLMAGLPQFPGIETGFKKRDYRGVEVFEFFVNTPAGGSASSFFFAVHKGYLALASYPQPIRGYVMRTTGALPVWKADERFTKAISSFPKEFTSVSYADPRPAVEGLIAAAPIAIAFVNGFVSAFPAGIEPFDVNLVPHAQEATLNLFPNITVGSDDGKRIRTEQRISVGW